MTITDIKLLYLVTLIFFVAIKSRNNPPFYFVECYTFTTNVSVSNSQICVVGFDICVCLILSLTVTQCCFYAFVDVWASFLSSFFLLLYVQVNTTTIAKYCTVNNCHLSLCAFCIIIWDYFIFFCHFLCVRFCWQAAPAIMFYRCSFNLSFFHSFIYLSIHTKLKYAKNKKP